MNSLLCQALQVFLGPGARPVRPEDGVADGPVFSTFPSRVLVNDLRRRGYNCVRRFMVLPSHKAPRWLLPIDSREGMLASTRIYCPHKRAAQAFKELLVGMIKVGWNGSLVPKIVVASKGRLPLENAVRDVMGEKHPRFALSLGTNDANTVRKLTLQIMDRHGSIIGYAKLPMTRLADERVRHEAATLEKLSHFASLRPHIPSVLYAGDYNDSYVLFQSPLEGERGPINLNGMHQNFLENLWNVQRLTRPAHFLIEKVTGSWEKAAPSLGTNWNELAHEVLRYSAAALGSTMIPFGAMHGDFAPWNTRVKQDDLLLFDWESAEWEAPTSWDMFHFRVQTFCSFEQNKCHFALEATSPSDILFMLYLLNSVRQCLEEGNPTAIRHRHTLLTNQLYKSRQVFGDLQRVGCASAA
jgi:hypothetical protein